jgi:hypothetical protein
VKAITVEEADASRREAFRLARYLGMPWPEGPALTDPEHFTQGPMPRELGSSFYAQVLARAISTEATQFALSLGLHLSGLERTEQARRFALTLREQNIERKISDFEETAEARKQLNLKRLGQTSVVTFVTTEELMKWEPPKWVIEDLLAESSIAFMVGAPGVGKTFLSLNMALSVAHGRDFVGQEVLQRPALYVAGEGASGLRNRVQAWHIHHEVPISGDLFQMVSTGAILSDDDRMDELVEGVKKRGFQFIVLDTFSQLSGVESENDAAQVALVIRNAARLRDANPGTTVLFLHHLNKDGKMRGSTAMKANADTVITVMSEGDIEDGASFSLSTRAGADGKQKDGRSISIDGLVLRNAGPSAVVVRERSHPLLADENSAVGRAVRMFQSALSWGQVYSTAELVDLCTTKVYIGERKAYDAIKVAVAEGMLEQDKRGSYRALGSYLDSLLDVLPRLT